MLQFRPQFAAKGVGIGGVMQASPTEFAGMISSDSTGKHYHIPEYQRSYSWKEAQWGELLEDIRDNERGYFMGPIICTEEKGEKEEGGDEIYYVVDGQQRLITLSILIAALYHVLKTGAEREPRQEGQGGIADSGVYNDMGGQLRKQLMKVANRDYPVGKHCSSIGGHKFLLRVQPSGQDNDRGCYERVMHECGAAQDFGANETPEAPQGYKRNGITKAYNWFVKELTGKDEVSELADLIDRINSLEFVRILAASEGDAYQLFESLNVRGVPLSGLDIIKNTVLKTVDSSRQQSKHQVSDASHLWGTMLEEDIKQIDDTPGFLVYYYNVFHRYYKRKGPRSIITKKQVPDSYKKIIQGDVDYFLDDFVGKAKIYRCIVDSAGQYAGPEGNDRDIGRLLIKFRRLSSKQQNMMLMYLFDLQRRGHFSGRNNDLIRILEFVLKYYVVRNLTNTPKPNAMVKLQAGIIKKCEERIGKHKEQVIDEEFIRAGYCESISSLDELREEFKRRLERNTLYDDDPRMTAYVLTDLADSGENKESRSGLWEDGKKGPLWSVEHVFPQNRNVSKDKEWANDIADGNKEEATRIHRELVHCLGNLSLSAYNSELSDKSFKVKQNRQKHEMSGREFFIGYRNGMYLNELKFDYSGKKASLATLDSWNEETILSRREAMVEELCRMYHFDAPRKEQRG